MNPIPADQDIIAARGLTKRFGDRQALDSVSFSLQPGEVLGYVGANGAGKTTTLRILVGTETSFQGELAVNGRTMPGGREEVYGLLGYMPQGVAFGGWRTAGETLRLFGRLSGVDDGRLARSVPEMLERVSLSQEERTRVGAFSGGMRQRLGLAQAILHEPRILLLDEPFNHLDPAGRVQIKGVLADLNRKGASILFSSHILSDVEEIVHRLAVLQRGKLRFLGTRAELRASQAGAKEVEIGLSPGNGAQGLAAAIQGVTEVHAPDERTIRLTFGSGEAPEAVTTRVLSALIASGHSIRHVQSLEPGLEEIVARLDEEGAE